ncbi:MAG: hypothetical protein WDZ73_01170 [Candidatus Paceibacterota bacterium]
MPIFKIWKPEGVTPLEAIELLKIKQPSLKGEKITYAGRLDPLAKGVLILLSGEDRFNKDQYLNLTKTYELEVLFGVATDTGDVMGLIEETSSKDVSKKEVELVIKSLIGKKSQTAPLFSSPSLDGKIFTKEVEIYDIKIKDNWTVESKEILQAVTSKIAKVAGAFRQKEIASLWVKKLTGETGLKLVVKLEVEVSAGTYMRVLALELGQALGVPALAYSICRTKVGKWQKKDCLIL